MPQLTATVHFLNLKTAALNCVKENPDGIRQAEVAKVLGIPSKFDHNWITKGILDGLVAEGQINKVEINRRKLFTPVSQ